MSLSFNFFNGQFNFSPDLKKGNEAYSIYSINSSTYIKTLEDGLMYLPSTGGTLSGSLSIISPTSSFLTIKDKSSSVMFSDLTSTQTVTISSHTFLRIVVDDINYKNARNMVINLFDDNN
jgi:hypothetical protein